MKIIDSFAGPIRFLTMEDGWLAVDKPAGLTIHNDPGNDLCSIINNASDHQSAFFEKNGGAGQGAFQPVHRLDRMTSGVVLLASRRLVPFFSGQFIGGSVKKMYRAIVHGCLSEKAPKGRANKSPDSRMESIGRWTWPMTLKAGGRKNPEGRGKHVACETRFHILETTPHYTLLECELITGRKHQIRRHARMAGHAVVGDERYGTPRSVKFLKEQCGFHRLGLHALSLEIRCPEDNSPRVITTDRMPPEMRRLLDDDQL